MIKKERNAKIILWPNLTTMSKIDEFMQPTMKFLRTTMPSIRLE